MRRLITIVLTLLLAGCADLGYYWHSASGHLDVMEKRVAIDELLADEGLDDELRQRLELVLEIRRFSVERLALPDNDSYLSYVELGRPYLIQNLFAAPEFSTRLYRWCYPVIGCASYRGYYDEERMLRYVAELEAQGYEVHIGRVSAYSTLGWFDDPALSSFIHWPDYRLAGLIFHELTHQQVYIDDDTTFNESLASAVQQVGTELWLAARNQTAQLQKLSRWLDYRAEVMDLIEATRTQLGDIYARDLDDTARRELKAAAFADARSRHRELAGRHGVEGGFTRWFAEGLNNAKIGSVSAYNSQKPSFVNMIEAHRRDFAAFYAYVARLGKLDKRARDACLEAWRDNAGRGSDSCPPARGIGVTAS